MRILLHDANKTQQLLPLTYFKEISELRFGILTQCESWALALAQPVESYRKSSLQNGEDIILIDAGLLPTQELLNQLSALPRQTRFSHEGVTLAAHLIYNENNPISWDNLALLPEYKYNAAEPIAKIERPWHIFQHADLAIRLDFARIVADRKSAPLDPSVQIFGSYPFFAEQGAKATACTLNTNEGPVYLGADSEIMEGAHIRGTFALGAHSVVKMGAKIYGATTIGPHCKIGGELANVNFQSYSNKAHDGFIGNAVIGSWCNLGADTNCSNLKNTYEEVKVWSEAEQRFQKTGTQFCGLLMGDHSKTGINTMLNTGTTIGAFCNIFGGGFPRTWIPPFSWGGSAGFQLHNIETALTTARAVMARRQCLLTEEQEQAARKLHCTLTTKA